ncbi:hypothetical protein LTR64_004516 [Lithohypha guttulata]|uniref:Glycosyltransferase family 25 protein n=1 Tax=Lithohypha guttulata TaxID=1690604 RepID=A0AAN7T2I4_9EURO|nr:hypothetical protein LTR51_006186 [Lithohypha guttulata]KAK5088391.1 hypothetical protein LTR05_002609 [Lithohypha guttulata]
MDSSKTLSTVLVQKRIYVLLALVVITLLALSRPFGGSSTYGIRSARYLNALPPREAAANETLGFQKILALSPRPSWRTRGLDSAGRSVGLQFTYPTQAKNPADLVTAFSEIGKSSGKTAPARGSATAWLYHIDLLKYFIMSGLESALIVEDDVDFDMKLKDQIRLASDNIRAYTEVPVTDSSAYGTNWDILWLGHCGTAMEPNNPGQRYLDESRCKTELYSGWSKHFLRDHLEEGHRIVQWAGSMTICTFGYGVHKHSAQKILNIVASGADEAFDVALSHACGTGALRCLVVNPQIMNHYEPPKDTGYLSPVHVGDGQGESADESRFEKSMGTTGNIMNSARCQTLFGQTCMRPASEI